MARLRALRCGLLIGALPVLIAAQAGVEAAPGRTPVRFELVVRPVLNALSLPSQGTLILRPSLGGTDEPIRLTVGSTGTLHTELANDSSWEVAGDFPGFWTRRSVLKVGSAGTELVQRIELWPLGHLTGRVKAEGRGQKLPTEVSVTTLAVPKYLNRPEVPPGQLECAVDRKGAWSCFLPAAQYDLVVSAPGAVPHYLWNVNVSAGKSVDVGSFAFRQGASVAGWVTAEAGRIDSKECLARLTPLLVVGMNLDLASRLERTVIEARVREDGFFQLSGLAPGTYQLEIRQRPLAPARLQPIQVKTGAETFLPEPFLLHRAVEIELALSPPLDWLDRPWHVQVSRVPEGGARLGVPVYDAAADPEGHVRIAEQARGRYQVKIADSLGNRLYRDEIKIESPDDARQAIEIDLVTVKGTVSLGREPLSATLWFGGTPDSAIAVKMESDKEGRFQGVLPKDKAGFWWVGVKAGDPKLEVRTRVEVHANLAKVARVDIALPDTRVSGHVLDEQGQPAAQARVGIRTPKGDVLTTADEQGAFEARALPEGDVDVAAQAARDAPDPEATSDRLRLSLASGQPAGPIELQLRRTRRLSGKVLSPTGPVPGAVLDFLARGPDSVWIGNGHVTADPAGEWTVRLPEKTARAEVVVRAPGNALKAFEVPVDGGEVALAVSEEAGTLEIVLAPFGKEAPGTEMALYVYQNGIELPGLWEWVHSQAEGTWESKEAIRRIPALAPGDYKACLVPYSLNHARSIADCAAADAGMLRSGLTLRLNPPRR